MVRVITVMLLGFFHSATIAGSEWRPLLLKHVYPHYGSKSAWKDSIAQDNCTFPCLDPFSRFQKHLLQLELNYAETQKCCQVLHIQTHDFSAYVCLLSLELIDCCLLGDPILPALVEREIEILLRTELWLFAP